MMEKRWRPEATGNPRLQGARTAGRAGQSDGERGRVAAASSHVVSPNPGTHRQETHLYPPVTRPYETRVRLPRISQPTAARRRPCGGGHSGGAPFPAKCAEAGDG